MTTTEALKNFQKCPASIEGREVIENLPHASRPPTSVNDDKNEKVKETVLENRRVGIRDKAKCIIDRLKTLCLMF